MIATGKIAPIRPLRVESMRSSWGGAALDDPPPWAQGFAPARPKWAGAVRSNRRLLTGEAGEATPEIMAKVVVDGLAVSAIGGPRLSCTVRCGSPDLRCGATSLGSGVAHRQITFVLPPCSGV